MVDILLYDERAGSDVLPYLEPRKDDLHDAMTQAADYVYPPRDGE